MFGGGKTLEVLARVYESLASAIQHPDSIPIGNYPYPYMRATKVAPVRMLRDEVDAWDTAFGITDKVLTARNGIVVIDNNIPLTELDRVSYKTIINRAKKKGGNKNPRPEEPNTVLYGGKYSKFFPFEAEGMEFYIKPHAILERTKDGKSLLAASMQFNIFAVDRYGRLAVAVPRPIRHGFPSYSNDVISPGAVVAPYEPIDVRVSFNTTINSSRQNKLEVEISTGTKLRMRAELHDGEKISQTQVPKDDRVELFFDQAARFLKPKGRETQLEKIFAQAGRLLRLSNGKSTIDNLFQTDERILF